MRSDLAVRRAMRRSAAAAATALALACAGSPRDPGEAVSLRADDISIALGAREILLPNGALGLRHFPDSNVLLILRDPLRLLLTSKFSTWLVGRRDPRHLESAVEVLRPGPAGSFDSGYTGIGGVYHAPDGRWFGFYHAEDHEDMPQLSGGLFGFHGAVGLARLGRRRCQLGQTWSRGHRRAAEALPVVSGPGSEWNWHSQHDARSHRRHLLLYYNESSRSGTAVCRSSSRAPPWAPNRQMRPSHPDAGAGTSRGPSRSRESGARRAPC